MKVLAADALVWTAPRREAASPFTLHLRRGRLARADRIAICGPSGCGKSTLLGLLALALAPTEVGRLLLGDVDAASLWRARRIEALTALRSRWIGFVPQTGGLLSFLTLGENLRLQQEIAGRDDPALIGELTERLGIAALLRRRPAEVSVGQRQRAAIARALAHAPAILLADEPTASLHPSQAEDVLALLAGAAERGAAVLIATHDAPRARAAGFAITECEPDHSRDATELGFGSPGA